MITTTQASEFETRFQRIREFLEQQNVGALFAYSPPMEHKWSQTGHVSYLSGWANHDRLVDSAVVVPLRGQPVLLYAGLQYMREQIVEVSPLDDVRMVCAVDPNAVAPDPTVEPTLRGFADEALHILEQRGLDDADIGVVGVQNMPWPFHESLVSAFGRRFRTVDDIVTQLRYAKSSDEVDAMKRAARLSDLGFETMIKSARPGMRGIEITAEMERAVRREGADHAKYWMASGAAPDWENVRLDIKPHMRVLQEGDLMAACSYVCLNGYWCHGHRTGSFLQTCPQLDEYCRITRESQDAGLAVLKAGNTVREVVSAIRLHAEGEGWQLQGGRVGHGIGLDYSERPSMFESNDDVLEDGTTVVVHATFALPGSGKMFVPLGDVCRVTGAGPELLMAFARTPFVAG